MRRLRVRPRTRPIQRAQRKRRLWPLAFLALLLGAWALWPRAVDPQKPEVAPPPPPRIAERPKPAPRRARKPPPPKPPPAAMSASLRDLLRPQLEQRASSLRCPLPSGAAVRVPARLWLGRDGAVARVELRPAAPLPAEVTACLHEQVGAWKLEGIKKPLSVLAVLAL